MSAREPADINRIEDAIINVERSALLLNLVVLHGDHLGADHATAVWQVNRLMAADVSELRRVYTSVFHAHLEAKRTQEGGEA